MSQTVLAIGNFDGVHKGHQALLDAALARATKLNLPFVVLTFSPHPRRFFLPNTPPFLLYNDDLKREALHGAGIDDIYTESFDQAFAALSAVDFVTDILHKKYNAAHVFVGNDFVYGYKRSGNIQTLTTQCNALGIDVTPLSKVLDEDGEIYSSTLIRETLQEGDMPRAARLLGREWQTTGTVVHGDKRGRSIGFPTANLQLGDIITPRHGVYAVTAQTKDGKNYRAVANFGTRPTVGGASAPRLEVHLLNFNGDLYDQTLRITWHTFLRPEQRFDGLEALKAQIAADIRQARDFF